MREQKRKEALAQAAPPPVRSAQKQAVVLGR